MLRSMSASPVVLIMAAGLGTRMKSGKSKVLHEIAGRPMLAWVVDAARAGGAGPVIAILGHQLEAVQAMLDARYGAGTVGIARQAEPKGTGHAVQSALPALKDDADDRIVVILSGDAPLLRAERIAGLIEACASNPAGMALLSTVPDRPMPYGRLVREDGRLMRIVEHPDATEAERAIPDCNAGCYAIRLGHLRRDLATLQANNAKGELYLTDLVAAAAARGGAAAFDAPFEEVSGINDRVDLAALELVARRRINDELMRGGVTMVAPDQVFVDADVGPIGKDVWLGPGVCLRGKTSVGDGARIDTGCVLTDVTVAAGAQLKPYTVAGSAQIGARAQIGPFAHLRSGTVLDDDVKVGNFVETKKTHMQAGAKANHLSYLGDAFIGARANIGAGTITCNYDGFAKHVTTIEAGAFIGSDTQLVAPVTVGRDAYVASGSTVTKDVPRGSLALSRVAQVNRDGWADRFREAQSKRVKKEH
jgi:bifunctional UDP-N-acetylglucosamine pyrophosphorylase/glucosamine-1-phosphate N-acetyltransferase